MVTTGRTVKLTRRFQVSFFLVGRVWRAEVCSGAVLRLSIVPVCRVMISSPIYAFRGFTCDFKAKDFKDSSSSKITSILRSLNYLKFNK